MRMVEFNLRTVSTRKYREIISHYIFNKRTSNQAMSVKLAIINYAFIIISELCFSEGINELKAI